MTTQCHVSHVSEHICVIKCPARDACLHMGEILAVWYGVFGCSTLLFAYISAFHSNLVCVFSSPGKFCQYVSSLKKMPFKTDFSLPSGSVCMLPEVR